MTKTKYLLYAFKLKKAKTYQYWYESDRKYFSEKKPPLSILNNQTDECIFISRSHRGRWERIL